jgi:hypothetical protein
MKSKSLFRQITAWFMLLSILASCAIYHMENKQLSIWRRNNIIDTKKQFRIVIHEGEKLSELVNFVREDNALRGTLQPLPEKVDYYYKTSKYKRNFKVPRRDRMYINQLHLFVNKVAYENERAIIDLNSIQEVQILDLNTGLTVLANFGAAVRTFAGAFFAAILISCNCPHVYTYDNQTYNYTNTLYTGAVYKNLERYDYKLLPDVSSNKDTYKIQLRNEEQEEQYTNFLDLIAVEHESNIQVASDQNGNIYSLAEIQKPLSANDDNGNSIISLIENKDETDYHFDSFGKDKYSNVYTQFEKPENVKDGKLVLSVKNSEWGGFVYKEFTQLFGNYHDNWTRKASRKSMQKMTESMKKGGVLMVVSVFKNNHWEDVETINLVGSRNHNNIVVPISKLNSADKTISVRIRSGFKFWDIDYIGMDYSEQKPMSISHIKPEITSAATPAQQCALLSNDDNYFHHPANSTPLSIEFKDLPSSATKARTLILCSKGYYVGQRKVSGKPQLAKLKEINRSAGLSAYSKQLFDVYNDYLNQLSKTP